MTRAAIYLAGLVIAAPASAQSLGGAVSPEIAVKSDVASLRAEMQAAVAAAQAAATAAIPPTCSAMPPADTVGGTIGSASTCIRRQDAAPPAIVLPAQAVTLADGTFSGSWPGAFVTAPTTAFAAARTMADPYICQVGSATTTTFAGKCWRAVQTLTLPTSATALLGLILTPNMPATAGLVVMVTGRQ